MSFAVATNPVVENLDYSVSLSEWFARLRSLPQSMVLSSGTSSHPAARFDILVADPQLVLRTRAGRTEITDRLGQLVEASDDEPFTVLARYCPLQPRSAIADLPFTGGVVAWFGYELLHGNNRLQPHQSAALTLPDMLAGVYDWAVVIDHKQQTTRLVLRTADEQRRQQIRTQLALPSQPSTASFRLLAPFASNFSRDQYLQRFQRIIDYIHAGDCYQVNLAQCFSAPCQGDSWQAFQHLQQHANAPFAAYLQDGDYSVLSFSPERFIKVEGDVVTTQPIKGTQPRNADPQQDQRNKETLQNSEKDKAENLMIVDLLRNDLGRVCSFGSVSVEALFELQSFTNVHHLVSTIKGRLQQPEDVFPLLAACFPGGSITGTPKLRSMQIINELETMPRSVYCGVIAWIDHSGNMDSNIAIRTLVRDRNMIHCWGGGGIVADSVGADEYQETLDKIGMLINNL
ncbi:MAG: aminodeoxychorismate synthase component I [Pseudomonadota bacterium]